jgi:hypothetical protein
MDAATFEHETARNQQAYQALRDRIRREHAGLYVALGEGRVLAAAATYDEAMAAAQRRQPDPEYFLIFPADEEPLFEPYYHYGTTS